MELKWRIQKKTKKKQMKPNYSNWWYWHKYWNCRFCFSPNHFWWTDVLKWNRQYQAHIEHVVIVQRHWNRIIVLCGLKLITIVGVGGLSSRLWHLRNENRLFVIQCSIKSVNPKISRWKKNEIRLHFTQ